jgi:acetyl-CoA carboxylase/biotin carboxylase 1
LGSLFSTFPALEVADVLENYKKESKEDITKFDTTVKPIVEISKRYCYGLRAHSRTVILNLLKSYYDVEKLFNSEKRVSELQVLSSLRDLHKDDIGTVFAIALANWNDKERITLVSELLDWLSSFSSMVDEERTSLEQLASLSSRQSVPIALRARKILIQHNQPSFEHRRLEMEASLQTAIESIDITKKLEKLQNLVRNVSTYFDVLTSFFYHGKPDCPYGRFGDLYPTCLSYPCVESNTSL